MKHFLLFLPLAIAACTHKARIESAEKNSTTSISAPTTDLKNIKSFAGCYEVSFNFAETFPLAKDYKIRKPYHSQAIEYIALDEQTDREIHLQHILVINRNGKLKPLKHWREEWVYEPTEMYNYKGLHQWEKQILQNTQGQWNQIVTQVDDNPRYECLAKWVNLEAHSYWECQSWNPLPRREYTTRKDYQVMDRMNRQKLTASGWIHEQDSTKINLTGPKPSALVRERGESTYTKVSDDKCKIAQDWWNERRQSWKSIRKAWQQVKAENPSLKLKFKSEEGELMDKLIAVDAYATQYKTASPEVIQEAKEAIGEFVQKTQ